MSESSDFPWGSGERLEFHIENQSLVEAHAALDAGLDSIEATSPHTLSFRKYCVGTMLSRCTNGARRGGVPADRLLKLHRNAFRILDSCKRWSAVRRFLHSHVDEVLALVKIDRRSNLIRVVNYVREDMKRNLAEPRTLNHYAAMFEISRPYLSYQFAQIVGRSYRDELRDLRMAEACRLLEETSLKVRAIALKTGMTDPSQFSALFRRATGLSPSDYRARHASNVN